MGFPSRQVIFQPLPTPALWLSFFQSGGIRHCPFSPGGSSSLCVQDFQRRVAAFSSIWRLRGLPQPGAALSLKNHVGVCIAFWQLPSGVILLILTYFRFIHFPFFSCFLFRYAQISRQFRSGMPAYVSVPHLAPRLQRHSIPFSTNWRCCNVFIRFSIQGRPPAESAHHRDSKAASPSHLPIRL